MRSGLRAGEKVARNIQYLIDSETQLKQAFEQKSGAIPPKASSTESEPGAGTMPNMPGMSDKGAKK